MTEIICAHGRDHGYSCCPEHGTHKMRMLGGHTRGCPEREPAASDRVIEAGAQVTWDQIGVCKAYSDGRHWCKNHDSLWGTGEACDYAMDALETTTAVLNEVVPIIRAAEHGKSTSAEKRLADLHEKVTEMRDSAANARDVAQADGAIVLSIGAMSNVAAYERVLALLDGDSE